MISFVDPCDGFLHLCLTVHSSCLVKILRNIAKVKIYGCTSSDMTCKLFFSQAFAIFCGLGIHNALMFEQACKLLAKQSVAMEVINNYWMRLSLIARTIMAEVCVIC